MVISQLLPLFWTDKYWSSIRIRYGSKIMLQNFFEMKQNGRQKFTNNKFLLLNLFNQNWNPYLKFIIRENSLLVIKLNYCRLFVCSHYSSFILFRMTLCDCLNIRYFTRFLFYVFLLVWAFFCAFLWLFL